MLQFPQEIIEMYRDTKPASLKAYKILRDSIVFGQLPTGEKFTEEGVASALGISRTPVRSALARLRGEGLLQNITKNTLALHEYSASEKEDLLYMVELLEGKAACLAAKYGISEDDMSALIEINEAIATYTDISHLEGGLKSYGVRDLHLQFHLLIAKCSRNQFLYKEIVSLRNIMRILKSDQAYSEDRKNNYATIIAPQHQRILDAIRDRKPEDAELYMRYEISLARDVYANSSFDINYL